MSAFKPEQIGVLINVKAGRAKQSVRLEGWAKRRNIQIWKTQSIDDAGVALSQCAAKSLSLLIISGGDGTVDAIIGLIRQQDLFEIEPTLLALPGGTTNMTARDITGTSNYKKIVRKLDTLITQNKETNRIVLYVKSGGLAVKYGFFFGGGAIPLLIKETKETMHRRGMTGPFGQSLMIFRSLFSLWRGGVEGHKFFSPRLLRIGGDEKINEYNSTFFIVSALKNLLLDLKPAIPKGDKMAILSLNVPYKALSNHIGVLLKGDQEIQDGQPVLRIFESHITLAFDGLWTLDGEIFSANAVNPLEIKVDKPISFLQI